MSADEFAPALGDGTEEYAEKSTWELRRPDVDELGGLIREALKTCTLPPDPVTGLGGFGLSEYDIAQVALDWFAARGVSGAEGMAEVLAAHARLGLVTCRCMTEFHTGAGTRQQWDDAHRAHVADALATAGYGPVVNARRQALLDAADDWEGRRWVLSVGRRGRAAWVRAFGLFLRQRAGAES